MRLPLTPTFVRAVGARGELPTGSRPTDRLERSGRAHVLASVLHRFAFPRVRSRRSVEEPAPSARQASSP
jgi:hypothetical protein